MPKFERGSWWVARPKVSDFRRHLQSLVGKLARCLNISQYRGTAELSDTVTLQHAEHPYSWANVPSEFMSLFSEQIDPATKHNFMQEAIAEACKSTLRPTVGAVLIRNNKIIGRGHRKVERLREAPPLWRVTHAEQDLLRSVEGNANGAILYVTLEPCAGRYQGPTVEAAEVCSLLIPRAGISTVVIGLVDQDPMTCGKGLRQLSKAGLRLEYAYHGLEQELIELIGDGYFGVTRENSGCFMQMEYR